jgi:hypothetical protein
MTDDTAPQAGTGRAGGILLLVAMIASLALLALHPGGTAADFAGVLKDEAANQGLNALVHGGFIAVLMVQIVGYAVFASRLDLRRVTPLAGLVFFIAGVAFLSASLLCDGLIIPALAAKYTSVPAKIEFARTLFVLCETAIRFLMPMGLAFQAAGVACWGAALLRERSRWAGVAGTLLGLGVLAALAMSITGLNGLAVMGSLAALTLWGFVASSLLIRRTV